MASERVCLFIGLLCLISLCFAVARELEEKPIKKVDIGPCAQFSYGCNQTCIDKGLPMGGACEVGAEDRRHRKYPSLHAVPVKHTHRTGYHFQPPKNWMNGDSKENMA